MYYQMRHVAAKLRQDEAMIRLLMPTASENDLEPLTIFENKRSTVIKTLTFKLAEIGEGNA